MSNLDLLKTAIQEIETAADPHSQVQRAYCGE